MYGPNRTADEIKADAPRAQHVYPFVLPYGEHVDEGGTKENWSAQTQARAIIFAAQHLQEAHPDLKGVMITYSANGDQTAHINEIYKEGKDTGDLVIHGKNQAKVIICLIEYLNTDEYADVRSFIHIAPITTMPGSAWMNAVETKIYAQYNPLIQQIQESVGLLAWPVEQTLHESLMLKLMQIQFHQDPPELIEQGHPEMIRQDLHNIQFKINHGFALLVWCNPSESGLTIAIGGGVATNNGWMADENLKKIHDALKDMIIGATPITIPYAEVSVPDDTAMIRRGGKNKRPRQARSPSPTPLLQAQMLEGLKLPDSDSPLDLDYL